MNLSVSINKSAVFGVSSGLSSYWQNDLLRQELTNKGFTPTFQQIPTSVIFKDKLENETLASDLSQMAAEAALINGDIDVAVHSMKDLSIDQKEGLLLGAVSGRTDPRDCIVIKNKSTNSDLPLNIMHGAIVGVFSVLAKLQLLKLRNDLDIIVLNTLSMSELTQALANKFDAIVVEGAIANYLQASFSLHDFIYLHPREFVPAPTQGVLAFQCRTEDFETRKMLAKIHNTLVADCTNVERTVLKMMGGNKQAVLGVFCECDANGFYHVYASWSSHLDEDMKKIAISQSTSFMLAEKVYENLIN